VLAEGEAGASWLPLRLAEGMAGDMRSMRDIGHRIRVKMGTDPVRMDDSELSTTFDKSAYRSRRSRSGLGEGGEWASRRLPRRPAAAWGHRGSMATIIGTGSVLKRT
jgi:hypothetical protein